MRGRLVGIVLLKNPPKLLGHLVGWVGQAQSATLADDLLGRVRANNASKALALPPLLHLLHLRLEVSFLVTGIVGHFGSLLWGRKLSCHNVDILYIHRVSAFFSRVCSLCMVLAFFPATLGYFAQSANTLLITGRGPTSRDFHDGGVWICSRR